MSTTTFSMGAMAYSSDKLLLYIQNFHDDLCMEHLKFLLYFGVDLIVKIVDQQQIAYYQNSPCTSAADNKLLTFFRLHPVWTWEYDVSAARLAISMYLNKVWKGGFPFCVKYTEYLILFEFYFGMDKIDSTLHADLYQLFTEPKRLCLVSSCNL